jgi:hypothetical protein
MIEHFNKNTFYRLAIQVVHDATDCLIGSTLFKGYYFIATLMCGLSAIRRGAFAALARSTRLTSHHQGDCKQFSEA